jgi:hypothetical protein
VTTKRTRRAEIAEGTAQILILLAIGGMAGAASFTHVHDWTMHNTPPGTGGWFGWANAVISELTPTAAGLEIRRRKRHHRPAAYPMTVLVAAAVLSLTAQVAEAKHSITGWLVAAVPALAFLALSKFVLSTFTPHQAPPPGPTSGGEVTSQPEPEPAAEPPAAEPLPPGLLTGARMAAFAHQQSTGQPISPATLATHLAITPALAGQLLHALDGTTTSDHTPSPVTHANGTPHPTGGRQ